MPKVVGRRALSIGYNTCSYMRFRRTLPLCRRSGGRAGSGSSGRRCGAPTSCAAPACRAGDGRGVLLIPGFLAGDGSLGTMTQWLRAAGWRTKRAGIRANVACSRGRVHAAGGAARGARRARPAAASSIIGQSRGGVFAKALGARRPDLVVGRRRARLAGALAARRPPARARAGRRRRGARQRPRARAALVALPARRVLRALPRRARGPVPARGRLRLAVLALGRDRRLALVPRPGRRRARRGPRLALRHERQRRRLPRDRRGAARLRRRDDAGAGGLAGRSRARGCTPPGPASSSATHSMCGVCGNMSTGRTRSSA